MAPTGMMLCLAWAEVVKLVGWLPAVSNPVWLQLYTLFAFSVTNFHAPFISLFWVTPLCQKSSIISWLLLNLADGHQLGADGIILFNVINLEQMPSSQSCVFVAHTHTAYARIHILMCGVNQTISEQGPLGHPPTRHNTQGNQTHGNTLKETVQV